MLRWAVTFLIIAIVSAFLGFGGVAGTFADIARVLFYVFIAIFLISLVTGMVSRGGPTRV